MNHRNPAGRNRRAALATRLAHVREGRYGEHGGQLLAGLLGLPARTWSNDESGVAIPGDVLPEFIEATGVEPLWLLRGEHPMYRPA